MFLRRLGQSGRQLCLGGHFCPQVLEMNNGDLAVVGLDITTEAIKSMPPGPGVGPTERVVRIPRTVVLAAIPELLGA
jgi:hypothetical protein